MTLPDIPHRLLDTYVTELRRYADTAKATSARAGNDGRATDALYWSGRSDGLMEAHGLLMAVLTAGREPVGVNHEVRFLRPDQAKPKLPDADAHYFVMNMADGMVAVSGGERDEWRWYWAPLTAVERVDVNGHRCPGAVPTAPSVEGDA